MTLPNVAAAVVAEAKVVDYLLNPDHPDGGAKARFFAAVGFSRDRWPVLAAALLRLAHRTPVMGAVESIHGTKYIIDGTLDTPAGGSAGVRTVWIVDHGSDVPRLVTAYPHGDGDGP